LTVEDEELIDFTENMRYLTRDVIRIDGDGDFASANGVVSGSRSEDDPYIISELGN